MLQTERMERLGGERDVQEAVEKVAYVMSTHASILVDSVGPPSAEVCRTATLFP